MKQRFETKIQEYKVSVLTEVARLTWEDKLQKTTGLDLRVFEDAITFKISLMVSKYMKYMEKQDF